MIKLAEIGKRLGVGLDVAFVACSVCHIEYPESRVKDGICGMCAERPRRLRMAEEEFSRQLALRLGGDRALDYTLAEFQRTAENGGAIEAAKAFDWETQNLYLCGPCGTGKTHLALAIVNQLAADHKRYDEAAFQIQLFDFIVTQPANILRRMRGREGWEEEEIIERHASTRCLILDDIGSEKYTEYATQSLYEIINRRYMHRRNGLILTSNLSLAELAAKLGDDRIPSRLSEMCRVVKLMGKDYRLKGRCK